MVGLVIQIRYKHFRFIKVTATKEFHSKNVLEGVDYTTFVDDSKYVARMLGFDNSFSYSEKMGGYAVAAAVFIVVLILTPASPMTLVDPSVITMWN